MNKITINGRTITCSGNIDCGGSCEVSGNVDGNIDAGGSVTCGNVSGDIDAGGSVKCLQKKRKNTEMIFDKEKYLEHLSKDVFVVKYKERSTDRIYEVNPNIDNPFYDTLYRNSFRSGEYILISGELPDKWK